MAKRKPKNAGETSGKVNVEGGRVTSIEVTHRRPKASASDQAKLKRKKMAETRKLNKAASATKKASTSTGAKKARLEKKAARKTRGAAKKRSLGNATLSGRRGANKRSRVRTSNANRTRRAASK